MEQPQLDPHEETQNKMAMGDMNDRVRIVFWDPWIEEFLAVTPDFLVENGVPFNFEAQDYCLYNSTHVINA